MEACRNRRKIVEDKKRREAGRRAAEVEIPGITPKDLLLTGMRIAWKNAHRKADEAEELEKQATLLDQEAAAGTLRPDESLADLQGRRATILDAAMRLRVRASTLRLEVRDDVGVATSLAKDVAPYVHPELMNHWGEIDQTVS
jgi:hypothetical protein